MARHFVVMTINNMPIPTNESIHLHNRAPADAAKKIMSIAKKRGMRAPKIVKLREATRGSKNKEYTYEIQKVSIQPTTVMRGGKQITYTFKTIVRRVS
jgi:hypothetical protein